MRSEVRSSKLLLMLAIAAANLLPTHAQAELSCSDLKLQIYPSPDRTLRAVVYPADISLDVNPDTWRAARSSWRRRSATFALE